MDNASPSEFLYGPQRYGAITRALTERGRLKVTTLAEELDVTPETIRRDLTALERMGKLRRVHGGAVPVASVDPEPSLLDRLGHHSAAKHRIALRTIEELPAQGTLLLDSGTTTLAVAKALPETFRLDVVTNSVAIAAHLADRERITLHLLGGKIRHRTGAAVGTWTTSALADIRVDLAIMATNGLTLDGGLTTPHQTEAAAKRAMVACARRTLLVADSSKIGQLRMHRFADLDQIDTLVTDTDLDADTAGDLDARGVRVVLA